MKTKLLTLIATTLISAQASATLVVLEFTGTLYDIDSRYDSDTIINGARNGDNITGRIAIHGVVPADSNSSSYQGNYTSSTNWVDTTIDGFTTGLDSARSSYPYGSQLDAVRIYNSPSSPDSMWITDSFHADPTKVAGYGGSCTLFCSYFSLTDNTASKGYAPLPTNPFSDDSFPTDWSPWIGVNLLGQPDFASVNFRISDGRSGGGSETAQGRIALNYLR